MIDTLPFAVLFLVYVAFCMITIDVYTQRGKITNIFIIPIIYLYYTVLIFYVINFFDINGSTIEKVMQGAIFAIACAIVLLINYREKFDVDTSIPKY